jgi:hypothetical protein
MKRSAKNPAKLTIRRETLRVLASIELGRVVGGQPAMAGESEGSCPAHAAIAVIAPTG